VDVATKNIEYNLPKSTMQVLNPALATYQSEGYEEASDTVCS